MFNLEECEGCKQRKQWLITNKKNIAITAGVLVVGVVYLVARRKKEDSK